MNLVIIYDFFFSQFTLFLCLFKIIFLYRMKSILSLMIVVAYNNHKSQVIAPNIVKIKGNFSQILNLFVF